MMPVSAYVKMPAMQRIKFKHWMQVAPCCLRVHPGIGKRVCFVLELNNPEIDTLPGLCLTKHYFPNVEARAPRLPV